VSREDWIHVSDATCSKPGQERQVGKWIAICDDDNYKVYDQYKCKIPANQHNPGTVFTGCGIQHPGKGEGVGGEDEDVIHTYGTKYQNSSVLLATKMFAVPEGHGKDKDACSTYPCPTGTYQNKSYTARRAAVKCTACPLGSTTINEASTAVSACVANPGYTGSGNNVSPCDVGTFKDTIGSAACTSCGKGTYQDEEGQTSCKQCPARTYQDISGKSSCNPCDPGEVNNDYFTDCITCDSINAGDTKYYFDVSKNGCKECGGCKDGFERVDCGIGKGGGRCKEIVNTYEWSVCPQILKGQKFRRYDGATIEDTYANKYEIEDCVYSDDQPRDPSACDNLSDIHALYRGNPSHFYDICLANRGGTYLGSIDGLDNYCKLGSNKDTWPNNHGSMPNCVISGEDSAYNDVSNVYTCKNSAWPNHPNDPSYNNGACYSDAFFNSIMAKNAYIRLNTLQCSNFCVADTEIAGDDITCITQSGKKKAYECSDELRTEDKCEGDCLNINKYTNELKLKTNKLEKDLNLYNNQSNVIPDVPKTFGKLLFKRS